MARYLFKLMALKDEYEVARLYSDGSFQRQLEAEFEGDYQLKIHFAPPRIPLIDWAIDRSQPGKPGRMKKIAFGAWFLRVLGLLAKLRFLRGTRFNPFGETEHRRLERELETRYRSTVQELAAGLTPENLDTAVEIASLPEEIRGYEDVREEHLARVEKREKELLASFRRRVAKANAT